MSSQIEPNLTLIEFKRPKRRECPVCYTTLISPVFQCFQGHLICQSCLLRLESCPVCRDPYPQNREIRAREFENMIREFMVECKYKPHGCDVILDVDDAAEHERDCDFKAMTKCPTCSLRISEKYLWRHMEEIHFMDGVETYNFGDRIEIIQNCYLWDFKQSLVEWPPHYIFCRQNKFYLNTIIHSNTKFISWTITLEDDIYDDRQVTRNDLKVIIKLSKESNGITSTTTEWTGYVISRKNATDPVHDNHAFTIPFEQLIYSSHPLIIDETGQIMRIEWTISVKIVEETYSETEQGEFITRETENETDLTWLLVSVPLKRTRCDYLMAAFYPSFHYHCPHSQLREFRNGSLCIVVIVMPFLIYSLCKRIRFKWVPHGAGATSGSSQIQNILESELGHEMTKLSEKSSSGDDYFWPMAASSMVMGALYKLSRWFRSI